MLGFSAYWAQTDLRRKRLLLGVVLYAATAGSAGADGILRRGAAMPCTTEAQVRLHLEIAGVRNSQGNVTITLYGEEPTDFLAPGRRFARIRVPAEAGTLKACMGVPLRPSFAAAVYHDENNDHDFNRTFLGLPNEGYGFSRDPETMLGIPRHEAVQFPAAPGDMNLRIILRYP